MCRGGRDVCECCKEMMKVLEIQAVVIVIYTTSVNIAEDLLHGLLIEFEV